MKTLFFLLLFVILSYIGSEIEHYKNKVKDYKSYLTGRIRYIKRANESIIEVEHYNKYGTYFKQATIKEIRYINSLKRKL